MSSLSILSMKDRKNLLIATSLFCIILIKRLLFLNIGVNWEESKDLVMIFQIANGEVIYRDFYHVYGYLGLYIYTIFFKVFGIFHILFPRLVVSLLFAISAIFAYKTASRFLTPFWALTAVLIGFSSLGTREHTYSHIFGFGGAMVALWGGLSYIHERNIKNLGFAGLACGIAFAAQPLPVGILSTFTLTSLLIYDYLFRDDIRSPRPYIAFTLTFLLFPSAGVIYFLWNGALWDYFLTFFPMLLGHENHPSTWFSIPAIFPVDIFYSDSFSQAKAILNKYLVRNLKWWLITGLFVAGIVYSVPRLCRERRNSDHLSILFLTGFSMVFEIERILIYEFNQYTSLFPQFVLLIYFGIKKSAFNYVRYFVQAMIFFLFLLHFVYTPLIFYAPYKKHGIPLGLKYAENVMVLPYTREVYREATEFIKSNSSETDKIVVADYKMFFYLFSDRENLFSENFYIFAETTFHPFRNEVWLPFKEKLRIEDNIINKIKKKKPALIIIPTDFLTPENVEQSPFLTYVVKNWSKCKELGDARKKTIFDDSYINVTIFCPPEDQPKFRVQ
ncbi:MAG TPA: hypothetical protein QF468_04370 [Nitrospinota bacterium]|nr:hypothetical protein [Nitrospinota bacterium]